MAQTTILEEVQEHFDGATGEIFETTKTKVRKSEVQVTDEFIKVSRYLNVIFAYHGIPLTLVPISLIFAQRMAFRTNIIYLLKSDKLEIAAMLGCSEDRIKQLIADCKKYDILRPVPNARGKYEVNGFLFSTGSTADTRKLQAHIDFEAENVVVTAEQKNYITGQTVRKSVIDAKTKGEIPGQLRFGTDAPLLMGGDDE